jgi:O-antigen ligase
MSITLGPVTPSRFEALGRWLFLGGALLMLTGDAPASVPVLSWPWLYLTLLPASFACYAVGGQFRRHASEPLRLLRLPAALLLGAFLVSSVFSQVPALSAVAFPLVVMILGFCWLVGQLLEDPRLVDGIWVTVAVAVMLLAARVIAWRLSEGLDVPPLFVLNNAWVGKLQLSWVFNLCAPLLFSRFLGESRLPHTMLYAVAWTLAGAGTYVLFSRMGMMVFGATTLAICLLNPGYWRRWIVIVGAAAVLGGVLFARSTAMTSFVVASLLDPDQNPGVAMRLGVFQDAIRMFLDHPVVGIGLGTFDSVAYSMPGTTANPDFYRNGWHAHNVFLHVLTETGIPGLLAWCYLWYVIVTRLWRAWQPAPGRARLAATGALCVVLAFLTLSLTEVLIGARVTASLRMNLTVGLVVMLALRVTERTERSSP